MPKFTVPREVNLDELNRLAAESLAASDALVKAQERYERARRVWRMMIEIQENHIKYYRQFPGLSD